MTQIFQRFVSDIRIVSDAPRIVRAVFNNDVALFTDEGKYWRVDILGKDFVVEVLGTPGSGLPLFRPSHSPRKCNLLLMPFWRRGTGGWIPSIMSGSSSSRPVIVG